MASVHKASTVQSAIFWGETMCITEHIWDMQILSCMWWSHHMAVLSSLGHDWIHGQGRGPPTPSSYPLPLCLRVLVEWGRKAKRLHRCWTVGRVPCSSRKRRSVQKLQVTLRVKSDWPFCSLENGRCANLNLKYHIFTGTAAQTMRLINIGVKNKMFKKTNQKHTWIVEYNDTKPFFVWRKGSSQSLTLTPPHTLSFIQMRVWLHKHKLQYQEKI